MHNIILKGHVGPLIIEGVRRSTSLPLEVHLMIVEPERYVEDVSRAGADIIIHQEGSPHVHCMVHQIKQLGKGAGVAINPATPAVMLEKILPDLDLVLAMTVNPGFGGQDFISSVLSKLRKLHAMIDTMRPGCDLKVDGGIHTETTPRWWRRAPMCWWLALPFYAQLRPRRTSETPCTVDLPVWMLQRIS